MNLYTLTISLGKAEYKSSHTKAQLKKLDLVQLANDLDTMIRDAVYEENSKHKDYEVSD